MSDLSFDLLDGGLPCHIDILRNYERLGCKHACNVSGWWWDMLGVSGWWWVGCKHVCNVLGWWWGMLGVSGWWLVGCKHACNVSGWWWGMLGVSGWWWVGWNKLRTIYIYMCVFKG